MTQAPATYDRYLAGFESFDREAAATQPEWIRDVRRQAIAHFEAVGLPTARKGNEPWKYTNVAQIANTEFALGRTPDPALKQEDVARVAPWCTVWKELVFVNGRYSAGLSSTDFDGVVALNLEEALATHGDLVRRHLGQLAPHDYDGFTALNTAFLRDGAFIYVPDGADISLHLHVLYLSTGPDAVISHPRTLIVGGRQSKLTMIESYVSLGSAPHFANAVTEIALEDGAHLEHYRLMLESEAYHVGVTRVRQGRDSVFSSLAFASGPRIGRNDFSVLLDDTGAECHLRGCTSLPATSISITT